MGKFRPKLKGKAKGKRWPRGQSALSNPTSHKFRDMASAIYIQEISGKSGLTQDALLKHTTMKVYGHKNDQDNESNLIAKEFENMSMKSSDDASESQYSDMTTGTVKTFQTYASQFSGCSDKSFSKLLLKYDGKSAAHKNMLELLRDVTQYIKEQGWKENANMYFMILMDMLKDEKTDAGKLTRLNLITMCIKSVGPGILRKLFSDSATTFTKILEDYESSENGAYLRNALGCLSVLLREQTYESWSDSSTLKVFETVLAYILHSKPKVRKAAQHAVTSIIRASQFMIPAERNLYKVPRHHPASSKVANVCLSQITAETLLSGHRTVLYALHLLKDVLPVFNKRNIREICEAILSLMTHNNVYIKTNCLHTFHALFSSAPEANNLTPETAMQLTRALIASRPPANDTGLMLAWAAVLQQAYICLARLDLNLCIPNLPMFVSICVTELWLSDVPNVKSASTNALKAILLDCVKPAIESDEIFSNHRKHIEGIFKTIGTGLNNPFNQAIKHVILTIAVCFEVGSENVKYALEPLLQNLNERHGTLNFHHDKEVEYAMGCAVKSLGPEFVLKCIELRDNSGSIDMTRSWLLPILKERISNSNLKFFATEILELATFCRKRSKELAEKDNSKGSHDYDLLCNQFWSLFPSFCNNPVDIKENFKSVARVLGNVLKENPEFRLSVMYGLRKLITQSVEKNNEDDVKELARFAKNYLPILLNLYISPVLLSNTVGQRLAALETIQVYLTIADQTLRQELFINAVQQIEPSADKYFQRESILDVIRTLVLYQSSEQISNLFEKWLYPLCETVLEEPRKFKKAKRKEQVPMEEGGLQEAQKKYELRCKDKVRLLEMEHKKAYKMIEEIFRSENKGCQDFLKENNNKIKELLMSSLNKAANSSKASRFRCIEHLINYTKDLTAESALLKSAMSESIICTKDINSKCRQCAFSLIITIGNTLKSQDGGMKLFLNMVECGFEAPLPRIISATINTLATVLFHFSEEMGLEAVQGLMDKIVKYMVSPNREIVTASLSFLKVYKKVLPKEALLGSLPLIFKAICSMVEDCKRHSRSEVNYFLSKMIRKYGAETIERLIPKDDEVMLRRLRNQRKSESRRARLKETQTNQYDSDSDDMQVKGIPKTIDDILKDSDSEMEFLDEDDEQRRPKRKNKSKEKSKVWIEEDPDNIVDLADEFAARKITHTDPTKLQKAAVEKERKKKEGFKMTADGRLNFSELFNGNDDDDDDDDDQGPSGNIKSESSDTENEDEPDKPSKLLKPGSKRRYDDLLSIRSGRTARSRASTVTVGSKYKAGGKGIHRPLNRAESVISAGTEYRSKKSRGDVKKKGKHDPYAYLPLSRSNLSKRKKAVASKQYKGVVKSKNRGGKLKSKGKN